MTEIYCAIDTPDLATAERLAGDLAGAVDGIKLGLEFFAANGPAAVERLAGAGLPIFLDVKLHDIPNTVAGAVRALMPLGPSILTVHAGGGRAMLEAAVEARETASGRTRIVGVTVLTSLDDDDLGRMGWAEGSQATVARLAREAQSGGLDGIVCSPREAAAMRAAFGPDFFLVVPGIRPAWAATGDQKRVTTPAEAVAAGADVLVIGRPITAAERPAEAAQKIAAELAA
ncbi:MAG: orotidine-5'-phosphate decarboxylase [Alphaproteobacteria bacterium]|nr:orotidine-5'-phosphate decarboxylase [Alphaproteobacteria bacterium]